MLRQAKPPWLFLEGKEASSPAPVVVDLTRALGNSPQKILEMLKVAIVQPLFLRNKVSTLSKMPGSGLAGSAVPERR
jgi:hypothetical protein